MNRDFSIETKTSIIIPCYNCSNTIYKTLQSLDNQSNKQFEVIIIDDGSTDNTHEIIESWIEKTKCKTKYIRTLNMGVSIARNKGLSVASGEFILFLDSDDVYHSEFVSILVNQMETKEIDTAFCSYTNNLVELHNTDINKDKFESLTNSTLMNYYLTNEIPCGMWSFIYRRKIIVNNDLYFTEGAKYGEDTEFLWKYLSFCKKAVASKKRLYGYFVADNSATTKVSEDRMMSLEAIVRVEKFLKAHNSPYLYQFNRFAYSRTLISLLKTFAEYGELDLYKKMLREEKIKTKIITLAYFPNLKIQISSLVFFLNPYIFYYLIRFIAK